MAAHLVSTPVPLRDMSKHNGTAVEGWADEESFDQWQKLIPYILDYADVEHINGLILERQALFWNVQH